jgi:hypothetical protein
MKLKTLPVVALLGFMAIASIQSCQKYVDGPGFSLLTRTDRVSNRWEVENYKINDTDVTSQLAGYTETYSKSKAYSYNWGILNGEGTWKFQNDDKEIQLSGNDDQSSRKLFILRLEKKSFWYYYMIGNDKYEIHLIAN